MRNSVIVILGGLLFSLWSQADGRELSASAYQRIPGVSAVPKPVDKTMKSTGSKGLAAFVDEVMEKQLYDAYIVGAAVAVVKDGEIVHKQGYGYSNLADKSPVDPTTTLFRMGSVSKVVTSTLVMQLVQDGQLELERDINDYLTAFKVPDAFSQPVTLKNLLTHSAGFEADFYGFTVAKDAGSLRPLQDNVHRYMPARITPPVRNFNQGFDVAYVNYGASLAGYIAQQRSGIPFMQLAEQRVFEPLGMQRTTFQEPLPSRLSADMSMGYTGGDPFIPGKFEYYSNFSPAGSLTSSVTDMARFMIAHLQNGRFEKTRILNEDTAKLMHSRILSPSPHVNGAGFMFMAEHINGRRLLRHGGKTLNFYTEMWLLPEEQFGLIVTYNTRPPSQFDRALVQQVMDRFYPAELPAFKAEVVAGEPVSQYTGTYVPTIRSLKTWEKVLQLFNAYSVTSPGPGTLRFPATGAEQSPDWLQVPNKPGVFRRVDADDMATFRRDKQGDFYLFDTIAFMPSIRMKPYETPRFNLVLLSVCGFGWLLSMALAVMALRGHQTLQPYRRLIGLTGVIGLLNVAILVCFWLTLQTPPGVLLSIMPATFWIALSLGLLSALLTVTAVAVLAHQIRRPDWSLLGRLGSTVLCLAPVVFVAWLHFWNLLGFHVTGL